MPANQKPKNVKRDKVKGIKANPKTTYESSVGHPSTTQRILETLETQKPFPHKFFMHDNEIEIPAGCSAKITFITALNHGRNSLCYYTYFSGKNDKRMLPSDIELEVLFPNFSRANNHMCVVVGDSIDIAVVENDTKLGFALINDSYDPVSDQIDFINRPVYYSRHEWNNDESIEGRVILMYDDEHSGYVFCFEDATDFNYTDCIFMVKILGENVKTPPHSIARVNPNTNLSISRLFIDGNGLYFWFSSVDQNLIKSLHLGSTDQDVICAELILSFNDLSSYTKMLRMMGRFKLLKWHDAGGSVTKRDDTLQLVFSNRVSSSNFDSAGVRPVIHTMANTFLNRETSVDQSEIYNLYVDFIQKIKDMKFVNVTGQLTKNSEMVLKWHENNFKTDNALCFGTRDL